MAGVSKTVAAVQSPQPSEFCNDENKSEIRSAMDAKRNFKKN
jgi:hypothetical protein